MANYKNDAKEREWEGECVCERESVCVCERESVCVRERERKRGNRIRR